MKNFTVILIALIAASCAQMPLHNEEVARAPSSVVKIISNPKTVGFIFLGKMKAPRNEVSSFEFALSEDIERNRISDPVTSPIGDFIVKPGTVVRLMKNLIMYTKAPTRIGGLDRNSALSLKEGTSVRILQYDRNSLVDTIAVIEVVD